MLKYLVLLLSAFSLQAATCVLWQQSTIPADNNQSELNLDSQFIHNTSTTNVSVCQVTLMMDNPGITDGHWKIQLWSQNCAQGTQYGGDSDTTTLPAGATAGTITFNFSTPAVVPALTDFHITIVSVGATAGNIYFTNDPNSYANATYGYWIRVDPNCVDNGAFSDLVFTISAQVNLPTVRSYLGSTNNIVNGVL